MKKGWFYSLLYDSNGKPELYFKSIPTIHWELKHTVEDKAMTLNPSVKIKPRWTSTLGEFQPLEIQVVAIKDMDLRAKHSYRNPSQKKILSRI